MKLVQLGGRVPEPLVTQLRQDARRFNKPLEGILTTLIQDHCALKTAEREARLARLPYKRMGRKVK